jgi:alkylated DNA repair protein alkB family protein 6
LYLCLALVRFYRYLPGQGILPHTDGPAYLPCTTTLSLGSHTVLCLRSPPSSSSSDSPSAPPEVQKIDLYLPPRSLLVLRCDLYSTYLHGIQPHSIDSIPTLVGCANWEEWWDWLGGAFQPDEGKMTGEEWEKECKRRKEVVETGEGWERGKRVSLTCRRVPKVRKGLFKLG